MEEQQTAIRADMLAQTRREFEECVEEITALQKLIVVHEQQLKRCLELERKLCTQ